LALAALIGKIESKPLLVVSGHHYFEDNFKEIIEMFNKKSDNSIFAYQKFIFEESVREDLSFLEVNNNVINKVNRCEKPCVKDCKSEENVLVTFYILAANDIASITEFNNRDKQDIVEKDCNRTWRFLQWMIEEQKKVVHGYQYNRWWDFGSEGDYGDFLWVANIKEHKIKTVADLIRAKQVYAIPDACFLLGRRFDFDFDKRVITITFKPEDKLYGAKNSKYVDENMYDVNVKERLTKSRSSKLNESSNALQGKKEGILSIDFNKDDNNDDNNDDAGVFLSGGVFLYDTKANGLADIPLSYRITEECLKNIEANAPTDDQHCKKLHDAFINTLKEYKGKYITEDIINNCFKYYKAFFDECGCDKRKELFIPLLERDYYAPSDRGRITTPAGRMDDLNIEAFCFSELVEETIFYGFEKGRFRLFTVFPDSFKDQYKVKEKLVQEILKNNIAIPGLDITTLRRKKDDKDFIDKLVEVISPKKISIPQDNLINPGDNQNDKFGFWNVQIKIDGRLSPKLVKDVYVIYDEQNYTIEFRIAAFANISNRLEVIGYVGEHSFGRLTGIADGDGYRRRTFIISADQLAAYRTNVIAADTEGKLHNILLESQSNVQTTQANNNASMQEVELERLGDGFNAGRFSGSNIKLPVVTLTTSMNYMAELTQSIIKASS
jgi:hypothetical protein